MYRRKIQGKIQAVICRDPLERIQERWRKQQSFDGSVSNLMKPHFSQMERTVINTGGKQRLHGHLKTPTPNRTRNRELW